MPFSDEEITKLAQSIAERPEQMTAGEILNLLTSYGDHPPKTKEGRCRAFSSLFRTILSDRDITKMLRLVCERSQFQTVAETLEDRIKAIIEAQRAGRTMPADEFLTARNINERIRGTRESVTEEIRQTKQSLNRNLGAKVQLLEQVAKILASLECEEKFDVPSTKMREIEW